jgi:phosphatidylinositol glycan class B
MYFRKLTEMLREDTRLRLILLLGALIQVVVCVTAIGIYHPDQHFQIIEFSSHQLHKASAATDVWEFSAHIRSTLQVYLFSAYYEGCMAVGIRDPYLQLEVLRIGFGLVLFVFFNGITLYYFRQAGRRYVYLVLLLLNFSWILPYTRTLFSSEMLSSLLFFGALFLYETNRRSWWMTLLTGFLFSLAFYARFQTAFAVAGFVIWMVGPARQLRGLGWLIAGFLVGVGLNALLDHGFYHEWIFTPYAYYRVNIIEGKAASMGTSSFLVYIVVLIAVAMAPPLSVFLLFTGFRNSLFKKYQHPLVFSVVCFILGHCLVAHKEERFLFPILNVLPIIIGWGLPELFEWVGRRGSAVRRLIRGTAWFSIGLNLLLLAVLLITPYSQEIYFTWKLKKSFNGAAATIYSVGRTPFETEHQLPFVFYERGTRNLQWKTMVAGDSLRGIPDEAQYVSATFDQVSDHRALLDSLGYTSVLYSSRMLWGINEFLSSIRMNTINDIWVLYKKK